MDAVGGLLYSSQAKTNYLKKSNLEDPNFYENSLKTDKLKSEKNFSILKEEILLSPDLHQSKESYLPEFRNNFNQSNFSYSILSNKNEIQKQSDNLYNEKNSTFSDRSKPILKKSLVNDNDSKIESNSKNNILFEENLKVNPNEKVENNSKFLMSNSNVIIKSYISDGELNENQKKSELPCLSQMSLSKFQEESLKKNEEINLIQVAKSNKQDSNLLQSNFSNIISDKRSDKNEHDESDDYLAYLDKELES